MLTHEQLVNKIAELHYPIGEQGMCLGLAMMGAQAVLTGDIATFHRRLQLLEEIKAGTLRQTIESAREVQRNLHDKIREVIKTKYLNAHPSQAYYQELSEAFVNEDKKLSVRESDLLSIDAFFQDLSLGYDPTKFKYLFEQKIGAEQYNCIYRSEDEPKLAEMKNKTLTMVFKDDIVTAYWVEDKKLIRQSFKRAEVESIASELPKIGECSSDVTLIEKISAKYGQTLPKHQDAEKAFCKILPKSLTLLHEGMEIPAIGRIAKWCGLYNKIELRSYFESLTNSFIMNDLESPVVFMLNSGNHSISVSYDPSLYSWRIIDANQLTLVDKPTINLDEIADWVMTAFPNLGNVPFATEIFCHKNATEQTLACFNACQKDPVWKKIHEVTKEKVKLTDCNIVG